MSRVNGAVSELVGPDEEDVSGVADRVLVLRSINEVLHMRQEMGQIMAELGEAAEDRKQSRALYRVLEERLNATQDQVRRVPSMHDIEEKAEITARHNLQELKLELTKEQRDELRKKDEARAKLVATIIAGVVVGLILSVLAFVAGRLVH